MRNVTITLLTTIALTTGCATWGTHVRTAGTLAEYLSAECGGLERDEQEQCIADELARWAECAAEGEVD